MGCSKCGGPRDREGQRYCRFCHAAYMREHRPKYSELTKEARWKSICRAYANVYQGRGLLVPKPCSTCGGPQEEKHHENYSRPLVVVWFCRLCHLQLHFG